MTETDTILVTILGIGDADFLPPRQADWTAPAPGNRYEAQQRHKAGGVVLPSAGDAAARKAMERRVDALQAAGLVIIGGKHRRGVVKLSKAGDWLARAIVAQPDLGETYRLAVEIARLGGDDDAWVSELTLAGVPNYSPDVKRALVEVEDTLLPALVRGWLESGSDCHGHVYYRITPVGRDALEHPEPVEPPRLPDGDETARRLYLGVVADERARLRTATPADPKELGEIPLSCSMGAMVTT